ncbi:glycosyltransferase family 4 protein [Haloferula helveola]
MPGPVRDDDEPDLIRTDFGNLESADWWASRKIDGLVLYAWGRPKFRKVAEAVRSAGIRLVLNQDSGGLVSPRAGFVDWWKEQCIVSGIGRVAGGTPRLVKQLTKEFTVGFFVSDRLRATHLAQGDWIAAVSPLAAERYRAYCGRFGNGLEERVVFVPHPVDPRFTDDDSGKQERIVAIGRWDDERQKRTSMLIEVMDRLLVQDLEVEIDLVGSRGPALTEWHRGLGASLKERVVLHGRKTSDEIAALLRPARISYCPSAFESFHIASAEALCCGCTVVAGRSVSLASFEWFVSDGDGRQAETNDAAGHLAALKAELVDWRVGRRQPADISSRWSARLHAPNVARRILDLFGEPHAGLAQ